MFNDIQVFIILNMVIFLEKNQNSKFLIHNMVLSLKNNQEKNFKISKIRLENRKSSWGFGLVWIDANFYFRVFFIWIFLYNESWS